MKKIISICALTALSFNLIGCTSTSATDKASQVKQEHKQNIFQLNSANITDIEILKTTNHTTSKSQTDNEKMIQSIVSAIEICSLLSAHTRNSSFESSLYV
ncbi:hypothetical protein ACT4US_19760, partial [Bacillus sp. HC-Mk]